MRSSIIILIILLGACQTNKENNNTENTIKGQKLYWKFYGGMRMTEIKGIVEKEEKSTTNPVVFYDSNRGLNKTVIAGEEFKLIFTPNLEGLLYSINLTSAYRNDYGEVYNTMRRIINENLIPKYGNPIDDRTSDKIIPTTDSFFRVLFQKETLKAQILIDVEREDSQVKYRLWIDIADENFGFAANNF